MPIQAPMSLPQALALALLLLDKELESPAVTPAPEDWQQELKQARKLIESALRPQIPAPVRTAKERTGRRLRGAVVVMAGQASAD